MLGKILGAMVGGTVGMVLVASGPLAIGLACLGAVVGHFLFDRTPDAPRAFAPPSREDLLGPAKRVGPKPTARLARRPDPSGQRATRAAVSTEDRQLLTALCPLFIELARADAPPVQQEIRVIREFFEVRLSFGAPAMDEVRDALKAALAAPPGDVEALTVTARALVKPSQRVEVVRSLYDVGMVDGDLKRSEQDVLRKIVGAFNLSDEQLQEVTKEFFGQGDANYEVLGISRDATDEEVKSAYRRLATEHHPDRATDGGAMFRQVKDAYEALRKLRGF